MRSGRNDERVRRAGGVSLALTAALGLSACSWASSIGSSDTSPSLGSRFTSLFSGAKPGVTQPASPTPATPDVECPGVDIRTGASTLEVAAKADQPTAGDLRYQVSIGQTARECLVQSGSMSLKVGVQGRVILGPMGAPGQIGIPLRYAVVREGPEPKTIVTKFKRVSVTVAPGQTYVPFVDVEEGLSFPLPSNSELEAYVIYVGFDEIADKNERRPPKSARKPTPRQQ
ncbi:MAG TPA: hypothetical protein VH934_13820 [Xanthobacteraceae bacterium]|jgi:hypothetical protein